MEAVADAVACARCTRQCARQDTVDVNGRLLCANCKSATVAEWLSGVESEALINAPLSSRFSAYLIDQALLLIPRLALLGAAMYVAAVLLDDVLPLMMFIQLGAGIAAALVGFAYEGLLTQNGGQTIGKRALGIRLTTAEGGQISRGQAWGRAAMRLVFDQMGCFGLINYLFAMGKNRTCVHDIVCKTRVLLPKYHGAACPHCNAIIPPPQRSAGPSACPSCQKNFEAQYFTPPDTSPRPVLVESAGPDAGAPCAQHAHHVAEGICEHCGSFACDLCLVRVDNQAYCAACFERLNQAQTAKKRTNHVGMGVMMLATGLLFIWLLAGIPCGAMGVFHGYRAYTMGRSDGDSRTIRNGLIVLVLGVLEFLGSTAFLVHYIGVL